MSIGKRPKGRKDITDLSDRSGHKKGVCVNQRAIVLLLGEWGRKRIMNRKGSVSVYQMIRCGKNEQGSEHTRFSEINLKGFYSRISQ